MASSAQKPDEGRSKRKKELEADDTEGPQLPSSDAADPVLSDGLQSLYKPEPLEQLLNGDVHIHLEPLLSALIGC